jgi:adenylate kinase family enzyme
MKNELIIMRGIPGSGKTTVAKWLYRNAVYCSADDGHIINGEYQFNPSRIAICHAECKVKVIRALAAEEPQIVVDNTNIHFWEFTEYLELALLADYEVTIIELGPPTEVQYVRDCAARNTHGVPNATVAIMAFEWEQVGLNWINCVKTYSPSKVAGIAEVAGIAAS